MVGRVHQLSFPRYGAQSDARELLVTLHPSNYEIVHDWVLVRKRRAVLVDEFLWPGPTTPDITATDQQMVSQELTRTFGTPN